MPFLTIFLPAVDPGGSEEGKLIFGGALLWLFMVNVLLNLPVDLLSSYSVYRIGSSLGIGSAWVAWIPGGSLWVMGCIADDYQKLIRGRKSCMRWILPVFAVWAVFLWFITATHGPVAEAIGAWMDGFLPVPALLSIGGIAAVHIALYRVYRYTGRQNSGLYTVLGLFFGIPTPFFLLHSARKM